MVDVNFKQYGLVEGQDICVRLVYQLPLMHLVDFLASLLLLE